MVVAICYPKSNRLNIDNLEKTDWMPRCLMKRGRWRDARQILSR